MGDLGFLMDCTTRYSILAFKSKVNLFICLKSVTFLIPENKILDIFQLQTHLFHASSRYIHIITNVYYIFIKSHLRGFPSW